MNYAGSHQERFDRAIYLTFMGYGEYNYKHTTKEVFFALLYSTLLDRIISVQSDRKNIYRLCDEKVTWLSKYGSHLGYIYKEDGVESYWIDRKYLEVSA